MENNMNSAYMDAVKVSEHCRNTRCGNCKFHTNMCVMNYAVPGVPGYWDIGRFTIQQMQSVSAILYRFTNGKGV
jgi:hypothetical protein